MSELDWDDLRYFLAAATAGSLAGAARSLGTEHSTIGRRLTKLEQVLGGAVVLRNPDGLELTALGRELLPLADQAARAVRAVSSLAGAPATRVRLAVPSGMSQLFATGLVELRAREPGLVLELISGSRAVDLSRGEADLALRVGPVSDVDLVVRKVGDIGLALYAARAYLARRPCKLDPADLAGHDIVASDAALAGSPGARWLDSRVRDASIVMRSREMTDMLAAAAGGLGLAVLPCFLGDDHPSLARLTRAPVATSRLSLVSRREAKLARPVRAVADFVAGSMRDHATRLVGDKALRR